MLLEAKVLAPPLFAASYVTLGFMESLPEAARVILDLAAIAVLLAGFLVVGRLRASESASASAAAAWKTERDAEVANRERLQTELVQAVETITELRVEISKLEARPTLDSMEAEIRKLSSLLEATFAATGTPRPSS